jgi:hypothetical protein
LLKKKFTGKSSEEVFDMNEDDTRKAKREKIFFKVDIYDLQDEDLKTVIQGYIIDISLMGALIYTDLSRLLDQNVLLVFEVPWLRETFQIKAKVIRCDVSEKGIRSGVEFFDMSKNSIETLEKLIEFIEKKDFSTLI